MSSIGYGLFLKPRPGFFERVIIYLGYFLFMLYAIIWFIVRGRRVRVRRAIDVLVYFYYDFLRLRRRDVVVTELSNYKLVTISRNPCPILQLSLLLRVDTRYTCKVISENTCKWVLKRLDKRIVFIRDYNHIRPYSDGCKETIYILPGKT